MKPFLSIIIPAYNEAKRLPLTLIDIDRHLAKAEYSAEILVVSDGSTDATPDIAERFSHLIKNLKLIKNEENHGKGWVVRQGMLAARGNLRLFMDADNSTSVDQFNKMLPYFFAEDGRERYDVVIGSRAIKGAKLQPPQPLFKRILGKLGNLFIQLMVLGGIWDSQCGFKCFTEEAAEKIFGLARVNRWGFDVEALALARELGYRIKEIPVIWVNDPRSKVNVWGYFSTLWDVIRIRWWLWRNKYSIN